MPAKSSKISLRSQIEQRPCSLKTSSHRACSLEGEGEKHRETQCKRNLLIAFLLRVWSNRTAIAQLKNLLT